MKLKMICTDHLKNVCVYKGLSLSFLFVINVVTAQNFSNGDFELNIGASTAPTDWTEVRPSPDIGNISDEGGDFAQPFLNETPSPQGGNFLMLYDQSNFFRESIEQTVSGFVIGQTYFVSYYEAVLGARHNYNADGELVVNVSNIGDFVSGNVNSESAGWQKGEINFVATDTSHTIRLTARAIGTCCNGSWMSFDGFLISDQSTLSVKNIDDLISFYPNPTSSMINIDVDFTIAKVFDLTGRKILEFNDKIIDLSELPNNIYLLKLYDNSNNVLGTSKVIKK